MKWRLLEVLAIFVGCYVGSCLWSGCVVEGHRKVTVTAFGQTFVVEDEVMPNDQGVQEFTASFDEAGLNVIGWIFDLFKDEPAEPPAGAMTQGDDDGR